MQHAYLIGKSEKHRVDIRVHWLAGFVSVACDGKVILRKPVFFKLRHSFEIGEAEKHLISFQWNIFDYFHDFFYVTIDGHKPLPEAEIRDAADKPDSPIEDAAAALLFVAGINLVFSVIGTSFFPDLYALDTRLLLFVGGLIYALIALRLLQRDMAGFATGTVIFAADSAYRLAAGFSLSELFVRLVVFYYLVGGIRALREEGKFGNRKPAVGGTGASS